jgi:hypothetical protein
MINDYGDPQNPLWIIIDQPFARDAEQGYLFSSGYGYNFKKTWKLSQAPDPYITCFNSDLDKPTDLIVDYQKTLGRINQYQPKMIVALGDDVLNTFVPSTTQKSRKANGKKASSLTKWAGSLLTSPDITYPHYVLGTYTPDFVSANWEYHEIQGYIDFGRVRGELDYIRNNGTLNPLPIRSLITNPTYDQLCDYLRYILNGHANGTIPFVGSDIETIRPKKKSYYHTIGHPGYFYTLSLAPSPKEAISYCVWDYTPEQAFTIWRLTSQVLATVPQIGQNYFTFDSHHLEAAGCKICLTMCSDTMIRHHILWPSLPHKLQFQTRQYTREPYYKDEGKNWSSKFKHQLMRYNCLDSCVTVEIWLAQEIEFNDRPYLR